MENDNPALALTLQESVVSIAERVAMIRQAGEDIAALAAAAQVVLRRGE